MCPVGGEVLLLKPGGSKCGTWLSKRTAGQWQILRPLPHGGAVRVLQVFERMDAIFAATSHRKQALSEGISNTFQNGLSFVSTRTAEYTFDHILGVWEAIL